MRLFIAALLPEEIKRGIGIYVDNLKPFWEGVRWERYEKFHITLKFLGETKEDKVESIREIIEGSTKSYLSFASTVSGFGGFPNLKSPRVLYVAILSHPGLSELQKEIEEKIEEGLGVKREKRRFLPHTTVGRVRGRARFKGSLPTPEPLSFSITEVALMKSVLRPQGSEYTEIAKFSLK